MHDTKLLGDREMGSAATIAQASSAIQATARRSNFWAIVGFCVAGLVFSLFVPASYLHMEQTPSLLAEAPLS
jgi:hypothetical protein